MGQVENINLMQQFIMEADCLESKTFVPIIWSRVKYIQPSNIDEYYEELWTELHRMVKHPEVDDMIQDITLSVLENAITFDRYDNALYYYYKSIFNRSVNVERREKNRQRLILENANFIVDDNDKDICDSCLNLKPIYFVWRDKQQHCRQCTPYVITQIIKSREEG
jgi:hypothetical protein